MSGMWLSIGLAIGAFWGVGCCVLGDWAGRRRG